MPALEDVAATLYALPPEEFTAARDEAAKQADGELRKAVKALRRPTVSAWLVNRLARERADLLDSLLELGPALAAAQAGGSGDELRELGRQRRELVSAVTAIAVQDAGRDVSAAVRTEVEQTLEAALADPPAADAVRSGALVRALSYAGFGGVDVEGATAVQRPPQPAARPAAPRRTAPKTAPKKGVPKKGAAAVEKAERAAQDAAAALDDAVQACRSAEQRHDQAARDVEQAEAARASAEEQVADLERRLADARQALAEAGHAAHDVQKQEQAAAQAAERAGRRVQEAQEAAEQARQALDRLRRS